MVGVHTVQEGDRPLTGVRHLFISRYGLWPGQSIFGLPKAGEIVPASTNEPTKDANPKARLDAAS